MSVATEQLNGIDTDALKQTMQAIRSNPALGRAGFRAATRWKGGTRSETRIDGWQLGGQELRKDFTLAIDEPPELLGGNTAPNPQEYLLAAMNACLMATYVAACSMQGIELERLEIESHGELDLRGFLGLDKNVIPGYPEIEYVVRIRGNGTERQFQQIHEWVRKTSPNYYNMANAIRLKSDLVIE